MEVKRDLRNCILLPLLTYKSEAKMWNRAQESRVHAVDMCNLRGAYGVLRWDGENTENIYEIFGMGTCTNGGRCGMVEKEHLKMVWSH